MRRIKRALSVTKAPKIEELADIHEHHEDDTFNQNGILNNVEENYSMTNNNKPNDGKILISENCLFHYKE